MLGLSSDDKIILGDILGKIRDCGTKANLDRLQAELGSIESALIDKGRKKQVLEQDISDINALVESLSKGVNGRVADTKALIAVLLDQRSDLEYRLKKLDYYGTLKKKSVVFGKIERIKINSKIVEKFMGELNGE